VGSWRITVRVAAKRRMLLGSVLRLAVVLMCLLAGGWLLFAWLG
jgi:hypothetical protein